MPLAIFQERRDASRIVACTGAQCGDLRATGRQCRPVRRPGPIAGYLSANQASIDTATLYGGPAALSTGVEDGVRANLRQ